MDVLPPTALLYSFIAGDAYQSAGMVDYIIVASAIR